MTGGGGPGIVAPPAAAVPPPFLGVEEASPPKFPGDISADATPTQRIGFRLAVILLIIISFVIVTLLGTVIAGLWQYSQVHPICPDFKDATCLNAYNEYAKSVVTNAMSIFDTIIVKALLPVLTAILGYIFGSQTASTKSET